MGFRWERTEELIFGEFGDSEMEWLRHSLPEYRRLIELRIGQYRYYDPLCDHLDMPLPTTRIPHPALEAMRAAQHGVDEDQTLLWWREADMFTGLKDDADLVIATLPVSGNRVELVWADEVCAWFWVLVNARFVHGYGRDLVEVSHHPEQELPADLDWKNSKHRDRYTLWWLGQAAHVLRDVSGQPLPQLTLD